MREKGFVALQCVNKQSWPDETSLLSHLRANYLYAVVQSWPKGLLVTSRELGTLMTIKKINSVQGSLGWQLQHALQSIIFLSFVLMLRPNKIDAVETKCAIFLTRTVC